MAGGGSGGSGGSGSGGSGGGGGSVYYAEQAGHAATADEATHATSADTATNAGHATTADSATHATSADTATNAGHAATADSATHATSAADVDSDSPAYQRWLRKDVADTAAEVITFAKGLVSTLVSKFRKGLTIGASDQYGIDENGDATLRDIAGRNTTTENLSVTKEAHFFRLVVDELLSNKGAFIISSANCVAEVVRSTTDYQILFSKKDANGNDVSNPWKVGDLAICLTFKAEGKGTFANVHNRYYWRKVLAVGTTTYDSESYYYVTLSKQSGEFDGTTVPAPGDNIVQLGYTGNDAAYRQSAVILSAYPTMDAGVTPPSLAFYKGIGSDGNNLFNLTAHRYTFMDAFDNDFYGNFRIFADNSWQNITTFFATAAGVNLEVTNLRNADAQLKVASDEIRMGVENGFRNYVANPLAIDATVSICRTSSTSATDAGAVVIDDADFGKVRQIYNYSQGDFQLLNGFDEDNRADLSNATAVTIFAIIKPMGYGQIHFGIWSSNYGKADLLQVNSSASGVVSSVTSSEANAECGKEKIGNGWWKVWAVFAPGLIFSELKSACGPNSVNASTWQVYYFGIMKGNGCLSVDEIQQGAGIKRAGIDIKNGILNLIADKVTFQNSDGTVSGKVSIDPTKGTLITQDAVLRGNLFLPYTRITQDNWSDYGTYSSNVGTTFNLLGEISGKTAAGLNIQIEYIQTVSSTTNLGHVRLPDLTDKTPESWVGCEVNILNATTTEPLNVRGTLNGGNFGLAKWSNSGWNVSDHNVGINPGCEGKFKLIKTGSGTYKWICCYINMNQ